MRRPLSTRAFLVILIATLAVVTTVPVVLLWAQRPAGTVYTGFTYNSVGDNFVYLNFIEQAKEGAFLFTVPFMTAPHNPALFNPLFLVMGWTARLLWLAPIVVFHLFRVLLMGGFLILLYRFLRRFETEHMTRLLLVGISTTGALYLQNREASTFLSFLASPLNIASLCLVLGFFWVVSASVLGKPSPAKALLLAALPLAQTFVQPYAVFLYGVIPLAFVVVEWFVCRRSFLRSVRILLPAVAGLVLGGVYLVLLARAHPFIAEWAEQAIFLRWSFKLLTLYFAALLPFVVVAFVVFRRRIAHDERFRFMAVWFVASIAVILSPYPYQNRLHVFLNVPLAYFAVHGMAYLWQRCTGRTRRQVALLFFVALPLTDNLHNILMNYHPIYPASRKIEQSLFQYLTQDDQAAFAWIRKETPRDAVFLHSHAWDTLFAARSHRFSFATVFSARYTETLFDVLDIYTGRAEPEELRSFLRTNNIGYVVMSDRERKTAQWEAAQFGLPLIVERYPGQFAPERYPFLQRVFEHGTFAVYEVKT